MVKNTRERLHTCTHFHPNKELQRPITPSFSLSAHTDTHTQTVYKLKLSGFFLDQLISQIANFSHTLFTADLPASDEPDTGSFHLHLS